MVWFDVFVVWNYFYFYLVYFGMFYVYWCYGLNLFVGFGVVIVDDVCYGYCDGVG